MFIDTEKLTSTWVKESPAITTIEVLKKNAARKEFKNLITPRLEKNRGRLDKKRELGLLITNRWSNNIQLLTNNVATNKCFILCKLFQPKSKSINLAFLIANLL